jgi:hypothetical protein
MAAEGSAQRLSPLCPPVSFRLHKEFRKRGSIRRMRFCPILTFREMNIMIGHAVEPLANVLVSFMFGL